MRGLGRGYTMIMINGEPAPRGFSLDSLAPEQVERIEIMRAPVAEHSARAIAGTINIVLREEFPLISVEQDRHRGYISQRNRGARRSTAPILVFLDDDAELAGPLRVVLPYFPDEVIAAGRLDEMEQTVSQALKSETLTAESFAGLFLKVRGERESAVRRPGSDGRAPTDRPDCGEARARSLSSRIGLVTGR